MKTNPVIESICRLPADFFVGSKSMDQLLIESGIKENISLLTASNIGAYLSCHLDLVEQWQRWSENKRTLSGWYFTHRANEYVVNFHPKGEALRFTQPDLACAEFIVREVGSLLPIS
jgi:hypothetical protein